MPISAQVLAIASPWFRLLIDHQQDMQPVDLKHLPCPHPLPPEALEAFVAALHSGELPIKADTVEHILRVAHAMQVRWYQAQ